ncbi:MAG: type IV toxin-antitoxin system AbiEi family antitoxin [Prevotellaceae bacterium]|jgi:predicted transcriptional regulator of viral defense system|nr:type IV toxin-antitoxin system AbiEi family antitoxin [Prevotellaceae bacterium]
MKETVKDWVEELQKEGKISFSLTEAAEHFPMQSREVLKNSLTRLAGKGKICSVWKGFYVIVPIEYQSKGIVPDVFYVDQLMKFLKHDYYVSLLSAAMFYGAAHQQPQETSIVTTPPSLRSTQKRGIKLNFNNKATIPEQFIEKRKTPTGYIHISSPELTATDLIQFEKEIGGLNRAATVLNDLAESLDFKKIPPHFFEYVPVPVIQRLGYLLDVELKYRLQAEELLLQVKQYGYSFRTTPLKNRKPVAGCETNKKWKIIVNEQIDIDE